MKKFKSLNQFTETLSHVNSIIFYWISFAKLFVEDESDPSKYSIDLSTCIGTVTLKIKLVKDYPMTLPEMDVSSTSHKFVSHDLLKALKQEVTICMKGSFF